MEYSDESNITLTGTIFGSNTPTLLQVDDCLFSSPVSLVDKLHFFPISANPSQMLRNIFEKLHAVKVMAMHSTWNGERGITVLKIDGDVNDLTKVFERNQMSMVFF